MTGASGRLRPDPRRKARFREIARDIVAKDRYNRKYGIAVDTAGAIAQALERAYRDGVRDDPAAAVQAPEQDDAEFLGDDAPAGADARNAAGIEVRNP